MKACKQCGYTHKCKRKLITSTCKQCGKITNKSYKTKFCSHKCHKLSISIKFSLIKINNKTFALGPLCNHKHNYKNTGKSLYYYHITPKRKLRGCVNCACLSKKLHKKKCKKCSKTFTTRNRLYCSSECRGKRYVHEIIIINKKEYLLGPLCNHKHNYKNTGKSLRSKIAVGNRSCGECLQCTKERYQKSKIKTQCCICNKEIYRSKFRKHKSYCYDPCRPKTIQTKKEIIIKCKECNKNFKVQPSRKSQKYCGIKCKGLNSYNIRKDITIKDKVKRETRIKRECGLRKSFYNLKLNKESNKTKEAIKLWIDCKIILIDFKNLINEKEKDYAGKTY